MQRRDNLAHFIIASVVVMGLTLLMVCVDVQAQIAFVSDRDGDFDIYAMDADGQNRRRLANNPRDDTAPAWFGPTFSVAPAGKTLTIWGWLKQVRQ